MAKIKSKSKTDAAKLRMWKDRWTKAYTAYSDELSRIEVRDDAYHGIIKARNPFVERDAEKSADTHRRNIIYELIESMVDTSIPQPKVTAKRQEDEQLARTIEDMLRDELDRMRFEIINDRAERMCPIQGGCFYLIEWDETDRTHTTVGENLVTLLNPAQVVPEEGVTEIEDMDYIFIRLAKTKEYLKKRYNVDFDEQDAEEAPEIRSADGSEDESDTLITQYIAFYRSESGAIGMYSWALDKQLCDLDDYQSRQTYICEDCGAVVPAAQALDGAVCPQCGSDRITKSDSAGELITEPLILSDGSQIDADYLNPVSIPYYKPDIFPVVVQRNVSNFSRFLGESDVDAIYDQQATTNRISARIIEKLLTGGSYTTLPSDAAISTDNAIGKVVTLDNPAAKAMISSFDLTCDVTQELNYLAQVYQEARETLGITDSFQGRKDATATSKVAKEFSAKQSAGRLESKRQMKNYAYSKLFEIMFKFRLAYADEPRPVRAFDAEGNRIYKEFDRYDFLRRDQAGELYWNTDFTFSVDSSAPLASNREAMWQETRMNFESGAFGNPQALETLILFWSKMELLHYPGAGETKQYLIEQKRAQDEAVLRQQNAMNAQMQNVMSEIDAQAKADAEAKVFGGADGGAKIQSNVNPRNAV